MASRIKFENSNDIGCYVKLTNAYCIVASGGSESFYQQVNNDIGKHIPVIQCTIAGTKIVGRLTAGNRHGLIVPDSTTEEELKVLREQLPNSVQIEKVPERLSALGNTIMCNDKVALIHPDLEQETADVIERVLKVEVYR